MRGPELVVRYAAGPPMLVEQVHYGASFRVTSKYNALFARSEPPAHDAWVAEGITGQDGGRIGLTQDKVMRALRDHAQPAPEEPEEAGQGEGLGAISTFLGPLLAPAGGMGAGPTGGGGGKGPSRRSRIRIDGAPGWGRHDGVPVLRQRFTVEGDEALTIEAGVTVRTWAGGESPAQGPLSALVPSLIGWRDAQGNVHADRTLRLDKPSGASWEALFEQVLDTAVSVKISPLAEEGGDEDA